MHIVALVGDIKSVLAQLCAASKSRVRYDGNSAWWKQMKENVAKNAAQTAAMSSSSALPMNYYRTFAEIQKLLPKAIPSLHPPSSSSSVYLTAPCTGTRTR